MLSLTRPVLVRCLRVCECVCNVKVESAEAQQSILWRRFSPLPISPALCNPALWGLPPFNSYWVADTDAHAEYTREGPKKTGCRDRRLHQLVFRPSHSGQPNADPPTTTHSHPFQFHVDLIHLLAADLASLIRAGQLSLFLFSYGKERIQQAGPDRRFTMRPLEPDWSGWFIHPSNRKGKQTFLLQCHPSYEPFRTNEVSFIFHIEFDGYCDLEPQTFLFRFLFKKCSYR